MRRRLSSVPSRLRLLLARRRVSDEVARELEDHLERLADRYLRSGMSHGAARLAAARQMGNLTLVREEIHLLNSIRWIDAAAQDCRCAVRLLRKRPGFAAVATLTLALGIGANTALVSVAYAVLVKPLPYVQPDEIYSLEIAIPQRRAQIPSMPASIQTFLEWRRTRTPLVGLAALRPWDANLAGDGEPEHVGGARVSSDFFTLLGVRLAHGRSFFTEEEQPGRERVVVISDALWRRRYGADPTLVGRPVSVNGEPHVVVGIAPPSLLVPTGTLLHPLLPFGPRVDIWKPIAPTARELEGESWDHGVLVRLPRGNHPDDARRALEAALIALLRARAPGIDVNPTVALVPAREIFAGRFRLRLLLIVGASALLLLTACVNLANMLLVRMADRANELATRIALGAGRARIISLTVADVAVITGCGGVAALALAHYGIRLLALYGPEDLRLLAGPSLYELVAIAVATSTITGLACAIVPAWHAVRRDVATKLQRGGRTSVDTERGAGSRRLLVGLEMALATALLASAGLLLHSFMQVMAVERGYQIERVLTVDLSLFGQRYEAGSARAAFYQQLLDHIRAVPGVLAAGAISDLPASAAYSGASRTIFHRTDTDFQRTVMSRPVAMVRPVTTGYFAASGTSLRAGRLLLDSEPEQVAVISEALAARLWPRERTASVVGRQIRQGNVVGPLVTIVGVVADVHPGAVDRVPPPIVYRPYVQWASGPMTLVVRAAVDAAALAAEVRTLISRMDPHLPILSIRTMKEVVSATVAERRFQMTLTSVFAVVALLLGAVGLYGVVSYAVAARTREIGLRLALGARRSEVMRWVFSQGMPPVLVGLIAGIAAAVAVARGMRSLLFGIAPADPLALGTVAVVLLLTSALACYLPARRAASLDPAVALRHD